MEERQTIITLKNVGLSYREIAKQVKMSVSSFLHHQKALRNWGKLLTGRVLADPKPQLNQRTRF